MADPFLAAHAINHSVYSLAGRTPISIRDQAFRAHWLVSRLLAAERLRAGQKLCVVGGGVAGATVAILAARAGVHVVLIERSAIPFAVQSNCDSRWIDPVQYDWPALHSETGQWPPTGVDPKRVPLGFEAEYASILARKWTTTLNLERLRKIPLLVAHFNTELLRIPSIINGGGVQVDYEKKNSASRCTEAFDLAVLARGIASERAAVSYNDDNGKAALFQGVRFWSTDKFEDPNFGLPNFPLRAPVLVSGAGDGALQDYIRLASGFKSPLALLKSFAGIDDGGEIPGELRRRIYEAEQEATRHLAWNMSVTSDHAALLRLHEVYLAVIEDWKTQSRWRNVTTKLRAISKVRPMKQMRLVHPCTHFSACYSLNHLVALVVATFIQDEFLDSKHHAVRGETRIKSVRPSTRGVGLDHVCFDECWGGSHEVDFLTGATCLDTHAVGATWRKVYDGVVIRHGLQQHSRAALRRHILPQQLFL